jgi:hypothetical protein
MTDLSAYIYKDGNKFYFDPENYSSDLNKNLSIDYEDGDMIKWTWEDTKMSGVLREENKNIKLFVIKNVTILK